MADGVASATMAMVMGMTSAPPPTPAAEIKKLRRISANNNKVLFTEGVIMCIPYKIQYCWGVNSHDKSESRVNDEINRVFEIAKTTFQPEKYNSSSLVARINNQPINDPILISSNMRDVLTAATFINSITDGVFNPSAEPGSTTTLPWNTLFDVMSSSKEIFLTKKKEFSMDLSGISKGWVIDELHRALKGMGITQSYVDWGGDIRCQGGHPSGRPWAVHIRNGNSDPSATQLVEITTSSVATSGDYGNVTTTLQHSMSIEDLSKMILSSHFPEMTDKSKPDTDIINPTTGQAIPYDKSSSSPYSISIGCDSCMFADALATTCMVISDSFKVREFIKKIDMGLKDSVSHLILLSRSGEGNIIITPGPVCNQSLRGVTRYIPHQVFIIHTDTIAITVSSLVPEWGAGKIVFCLETSSRLTSYLKENITSEVQLRLSALPGDEASVELSKKHGTHTITTSAIRSLPFSLITVTETEECGDHVIVFCHLSEIQKPFPESKLLTASDTTGRWYKKALTMEHTITCLAVLSFNDSKGKPTKIPVRHLGSASGSPPFVHFVAQDPELVLQPLQTIEISISSPEGGVNDRLKRHGIIHSKIRKVLTFASHTHYIVASVTKIEPPTRYNPLVVDISGSVMSLVPIGDTPKPPGHDLPFF